MVKAHLRNYSNYTIIAILIIWQRKRRFQLKLNSIICSEGECYEGGDFKLNLIMIF